MKNLANLITQLEAAAREATPGPWSIQDDSVCAFIARENEECILFGGWDGFQTDRDKEYVALANPATILQLTAALREAVEILGHYSVLKIEHLGDRAAKKWDALTVMNFYPGETLDCGSEARAFLARWKEEGK